MARKNDIFKADPQAQKGSILPEGVQRQDVMKDLGWEVPVEAAPLPSQGIVYPKNSSLYGQETLAIKAMTAREEDILMSRAYSKAGTTITELIKSCLIDKSVDPGDLLVGDRQALIVSIRITGYGADYECDVTCPACGVRSTSTFDLSSLEITRMSTQPIQPGTNEFQVTLPVSKKSIILKFMTGRDEEELNLTLERRKKLLGEGSENFITSRLAHQIISVDGITDKNKINIFVTNMPARDSLFLRDFVAKNEPGISMKSPHNCKSCNATSEVALPMGVSFFWPG